MTTGGNWKELYWAAQTGDLELVEYHCQTGVDINYQHPEFMTTPLIASIENKHLAIAKYLLENGADPTAKEFFGKLTPLTAAEATGNAQLIDLIRFYLNKNQNLNQA